MGTMKCNFLYDELAVRLIAERFRRNLLWHFMCLVDCVRSCTLGWSDLKPSVPVRYSSEEYSVQYNVSNDRWRTDAPIPAFVNVQNPNHGTAINATENAFVLPGTGSSYCTCCSRSL